MPPPIDPPLFLVVDDEPFVRVIVMRMIQVFGFAVEASVGGLRQIRLERTQASSAYVGLPNVLQAADGREATALLASNPIDCVISDVRMPVMSGIELLQAVRTGDTGAPRATRFALLTAHAESEVVSAAMALDVNAFLTKPVAARTLEARLTRLFTESWPLRDAAAYRAVPVPDWAVATPRHGRRDEAAPGPDSAEAAQALWAGRRTPVARPLDLVPEDAVLARPVIGPAREPIIAQGTVLTRLQLNRLQELGEMGVRIDELWVYLPDA